METTLEKLKRLEKILEQGNAPILKYFNAGLKKEEVAIKLLQNDIYPNESLILLYEWHNGVKYKNGNDFSQIELLPDATFYSLDWALERRSELIDWAIIDSPEFYLPIFGSLEDDLYLLKNDEKGEIYYSSPRATIYAELDFKSIDIMLDVLIDCYNERIFEIDSSSGLSYAIDRYFYKKSQYI